MRRVTSLLSGATKRATMAGNHGGQPLGCDFAVPDCVVRLNERVGDLWRSAKRLPSPFLEYATPFLGLLVGKIRS